MHVDQVVPVFRIFDVAKAKEFYVDFLGFTVDWEHTFDAVAPLYMQVSRAGCVLHLSEHYGDACPGSTITVRMTGLIDYHRELSDKKYGYYRPGIERMPWNFDQMVVIDPFGNRIRFGEEVVEGEG